MLSNISYVTENLEHDLEEAINALEDVQTTLREWNNELEQLVKALDT